MANQFIVQPPFSKQLTTLAYPLTGGSSQTLQTGYMIWDKPLPGYSQRAVVRYLYNPSTASADYSIADASAQASLNFPNPGDTANLAIPLSQTAQWSLMFDRTFEVWGAYQANGQPNGTGIDGNSSTGPGTIGVQADVLAFMQLTGMLTNFSAGTANISGPITQNSGIMQLVPSWAVFASNAVTNGLTFYGYVNEWSVQYTHWTQFNVPMRCVISVNFTMLPSPSTAPPAQPGVTTLPNGNPGPGATGTGVTTGIGGR